jgi:hypothetical protein
MMTDFDAIRELDRLRPDWFIDFASTEAMRDTLFALQRGSSSLDSELEILRVRTYSEMSVSYRLYNAAHECVKKKCSLPIEIPPKVSTSVELFGEGRPSSG